MGRRPQIRIRFWLGLLVLKDDPPTPEEARVFVYIPKVGYVGVGVTTGQAQRFQEIEVTFEKPTKLSDLHLQGTYTHPDEAKR